MLLVPPLSTATNDRATHAILNCVALRPQNWDGADVLIADMALREFDPSGRRQTGVGLCQLSRVNADPAVAANLINSLHRAFDINAQVGPDIARRHVYEGAVHGIEIVRSTTQAAALKLGIELPKQVLCSAYRPDSSPRWARLALWLQTVRLHHSLQSQPELRVRVIEEIGEKAEALRATAKARQGRIVQAHVAQGSPAMYAEDRPAAVPSDKNVHDHRPRADEPAT